MNNLFQNTSSHWVRYDKYDCKEADDGLLYVTPAPKAKPAVYDLSLIHIPSPRD